MVHLQVAFSTLFGVTERLASICLSVVCLTPSRLSLWKVSFSEQGPHLVLRTQEAEATGPGGDHRCNWQGVTLAV